MDLQKRWEKALKKTEIIRPRVAPLQTFEATKVPYIFLSKSTINKGDTVVRRGEVTVEKPMIISPMAMPFFDGFNFEQDMHVSEDFLKTFFMVRGISFPSMKYNNATNSLDIYEGSLNGAINHFANQMEREENIHSGLLAGPEDAWQFSVLIFVCLQISRGANNDAKKLFDDFFRRGNLS